MKKILLLTFILTLKTCLAQWNLVPCPTTLNLNSIHFGDQNVGFAVGASNTVIKTIDQGVTWSQIFNQPNITNFTSVHCNNADTCFAIGWNTSVKNTLDGTNWTSMTGSGSSGTCIWSIPQKYIIYTGQASASGSIGCGCYNGNCSFGYVTYTKNFGTSWQTAWNKQWPPFTCIQFLDTVTGYACGVNGFNQCGAAPVGQVMKSSDGGQNWQTLGSTYGHNWCNLHFPNNTTGYVVGDNGWIKKTTDGGNNWVTLSSGTINKLNSVYFISSDTGCAVGDGGVILKTSNGGMNWQLVSSPTAVNLNSVYFIDHLTGVIAGNNGTILKTNQGPLGFKELENNKVIRCFPNPTSGIFNLKVMFKSEVSAIDFRGIELFSKQFESGLHQIDLSSYPAGVYCIKIGNATGQILKKVLKVNSD